MFYCWAPQVLQCIIALILMHAGPYGGTTDLVVTKEMSFTTAHTISHVSIYDASYITYCMYTPMKMPYRPNGDWSCR